MARPDFVKKWASSRPSIPEIGSVDYAGGWLAYLGTTPPSADDHDYVMNLQDERAVWLGEQALLAVGHEWQSDVTYDEDAYVRPVGGGPLYRSLNAVNLNHEPTASPAFWKEVAIGDVQDASTTVKGIVELADNTETQTGTDTVRAVTPAGLASVTATETRRGLVELATTTEARAGTDTARAVTPAGIGASVLGIGQTWQNVTGSRALDTDYTNSTGRPICVSISVVSGGTNALAEIIVSGVSVARTLLTNTNASNVVSVNAIVPAGATYSAPRGDATDSIEIWAELR